MSNLQNLSRWDLKRIIDAMDDAIRHQREIQLRYGKKDGARAERQIAYYKFYKDQFVEALLRIGRKRT